MTMAAGCETMRYCIILRDLKFLFVHIETTLNYNNAHVVQRGNRQAYCCHSYGYNNEKEAEWIAYMIPAHLAWRESAAFQPEKQIWNY